MKNILLSVTLLIFFASCSKETVELVGKQSDQEKQEIGLLRLATDVSAREGSMDFNYTLKGEAGHKPDGKPMWDLIQQLNSAKYQMPLLEVQNAVDEIINEYDINVLEYDRDFRPAIQLFAYEVGHRAALREPESAERNKIVEESLNVLVIQQADDTDAFAEMLYLVASDLSAEDFKRYYDYVRGVAENQISSYEANYETYKAEFPGAEDSELDRRRWLMMNRGTAQRYKQALASIELLDRMIARD